MLGLRDSASRVSSTMAPHRGCCLLWAECTVSKLSRQLQIEHHGCFRASRWRIFRRLQTARSFVERTVYPGFDRLMLCGLQRITTASTRFMRLKWNTRLGFAVGWIAWLNFPNGT